VRKGRLRAVRRAEQESKHWARIYPPWKKFRDDQYLWFRVAEFAYDSFAFRPARRESPR
jgi:TRAP-type mannitol/chloroaromatic compound transport system substrate-binding protein